VELTMSASRFIVTGAASGIGAATLAALKAAGHRCLAIDRKPLPGEEFLACDLADESSIAACIEAIDGPVDGVAHVAGIAGTADAAQVLKVNYLGARRFIEMLSPKIVEGGSVVVVSSLAARRCVWHVTRLREMLAFSDWPEALAAKPMRSPSGCCSPGYRSQPRPAQRGGSASMPSRQARSRRHFCPVSGKAWAKTGSRQRGRWSVGTRCRRKSPRRSCSCSAPLRLG
jgi:hypothetical protein